MLDTALASVDLSKLVLVIGGLDTAAYGLVDATKALGGGVSRAGFGDIKKVLSQLIPPASALGGRDSALTQESAYVIPANRKLRTSLRGNRCLGHLSGLRVYQDFASGEPHTH